MCNFYLANMLFVTLYSAITGLILCILYKIIPPFYRKYQLVEKIPGPPIESRLLGNKTVVLLKLKDLPEFISQQYKEFGGIFRHWYSWIPCITIAEADFAEVFFTHKSLEDKALYYKIAHDWLGLGLIMSNGALWRERRKLITPAFHFSILNAMCETLAQNSAVLVQKLREIPIDSPVNIYTIMHLVALDNICESAMGIKIDALNNPKVDYVQAVENASQATAERLTQPWFWSDLYFCTPAGRKLRRSLKQIFELAKTAIRNSREKRDYTEVKCSKTGIDDVNGKRRLAFLDLLMKARDSNTKAVSDDGLRDEVNTFTFAGHETVATSMSFTLFLLGIHPDIQEKCYQELEDIFQGSDRKPTVDDLRAMKYLGQVIKESLRLYPSAPLIGRRVKEDVKFGNYIVPKGSQVNLHVFCLHRDPKYFPNPDVFDPDRFSPENTAKRHPFAYVPFAAGSRNCIGQKFAMMEEKVVLSSILRNFTVESTYGMEELQFCFDLVLRTLKPLTVKFKPRNVSRL